MDLANDRIYLADIAIRIREAAMQRAELPLGDTDELFLIYAVLALVKGPGVTPADVHHAWVAWMIPQDPTHDALVPYADLDPTTASYDAPFAEAVRDVALELAS